MQLKIDLNKRWHYIEERQVKCKRFWVLLDEFVKYNERTKDLLQEYAEAKIYTPTSLDPTVCFPYLSLISSMLYRL